MKMCRITCCAICCLLSLSGCRLGSQSSTAGNWNPFAHEKADGSERNPAAYAQRLHVEAESAVRSHRIHTAVEKYQTLLAFYEKHPEQKRAEPYCELGQILEDLGQMPQAEARYKEAIALDSNNPEPYNRIGYCMLSQRRNEEAVEWLAKAVAMNGTNVEYQRNLGLAYGAMGDDRAALAAFRKVGSEENAQRQMSAVYAMRSARASGKLQTVDTSQRYGKKVSPESVKNREDR